MGRISREEGLRIAERAAWAEHGSEHKFWFTYGQRLLPVGLAAAGLGTVVWGVRWAWERATSIDVDTTHAVPGIAWAALLVLIALTAVALRSFNRARSMGVVVALVAFVAMGWLGAGAYALAMI
jgi:hypothetical protein